MIQFFNRRVSQASFRLVNFVAIACYAHVLAMQGHSLFASIVAAIAVASAATPVPRSAQVSA